MKKEVLELWEVASCYCMLHFAEPLCDKGFDESDHEIMPETEEEIISAVTEMLKSML